MIEENNKLEKVTSEVFNKFIDSNWTKLDLIRIRTAEPQILLWYDKKDNNLLVAKSYLYSDFENDPSYVSEKDREYYILIDYGK